ncbi:MAG: saccharopine dehydrogenase NADP-binding domain-containing protein, partial [Chloroflexota bacterium]
MITLFGATGYTGRLIAHQLASLSLPAGSIRLAGRSLEKLKQLASELPYKTEINTADATIPSTLPALFKNTRVLINCAGPFTDLGEPVVALAAIHGAHYLDTTNELGFVHRMQSYHQLAVSNQAAIVPACGFEIAFADCAAALLAEQLGSQLDAIDVIYALSGGNSSRGTRLSAIRSLGTSWLAYRGGDWVSAVPCSSTRT